MIEYKQGKENVVVNALSRMSTLNCKPMIIHQTKPDMSQKSSTSFSERY